jgi:hypothetical protein
MNRYSFLDHRLAPQDDQSNPLDLESDLSCFLLPLTDTIGRFLAAARSAPSPNDTSFTDNETFLLFRPASWLRRGPHGAAIDSRLLFAVIRLDESGGIGTGRVEIGFRDRTDLGGATMTLVRGREEASSLAICADDFPNGIAKGFLDAKGFVDDFTLSRDPSVSLCATRCRSESISCIPCTPFVARSFVRSTDMGSSRLHDLGADFTIGESCA